MDNIKRTITTATGKQYAITAAAVGSIDSALRIWIISSTFSEIIDVFTDEKETCLLIDTNDGIERKYTGYTDFRGIAIERTGEIMVTLARGD